MELLLFSVFIVFNFFIRLVFSLSKNVSHSDAYVHLFVIDQRRKHGLDFEVRNSLIPGPFSYPPLQHMLVGFFPRKMWVPVAKSLNIINDILLIICTYVTANFVVSYLNFPIQSVTGLSIGFFTALISSTTPILFGTNSRIAGAGARTLGGLIVFVYLVSFGCGYYFYPPAFALCFVLSVVVCYSSVFALQTMLFLSIGLSIGLQSFLPLMSFFLPILIAFLLNFRGLRALLNIRLSQYTWYIRNNEIQLGGRNNWADVIAIPKMIFKKQFGRLSGLIFRSNSFIITFYSIPIISLLLFFASKDFDSFWSMNQNYPILYYCFIIVASLLGAFLLTSSKHFLWFGAAERYLEYCLPFLSFIFVFFVISQQALSEFIWPIIVILHFIVILFVYIFFFRKEELKANFSPANSLSSPTIEDFLPLLNSLKPCNILCLPSKLSFYFSVLVKNPQAKFYYQFIDRANGRFNYMDEDHLSLGIIKPDLKSMVLKWDIDTIIVSNTHINRWKKNGEVDYDFSDWNIICENKDYTVYRLKDK